MKTVRSVTTNVRHLAYDDESKTLCNLIDSLDWIFVSGGSEPFFSSLPLSKCERCQTVAAKRYDELEQVRA